MKKYFLLTALSAALSFAAQAQFGALKDKALKFGKDKGAEAVDKNRDRLDSVDFNYAISVIDNSSMKDVTNAGEVGSKVASAKFGSDTPEKKNREMLDLGEIYYQRRWFNMAAAQFLATKLSYETDGITNNINYSKVNADLGLLYATMGRYSTAETYTAEALSIREKTLGVDSKAYASSLNNMGVLYQETARFNESLNYFEQALKTVQKQYGPESQEYAIVLNNQAILFAEIGRTEQAITNLNSSIAILDKMNKTSERNQKDFKSNLAMLYQQTGKYAEAEAIYLKMEKLFGTGSPYYAGVENSLGLLYIQMDKMDKVEVYLKKAATIYDKKFGKESPNYAKVLNDLGNFYRLQGRFDEAEKNLTESLTIRSKALDSNHPDYVKSQEDLAILYWKKGDLEKAASSFQIAMDKSLDFINRYFPPMSEAEKTKYWDVLQPRFQRYYNYCLEASATNPAIVQNMYDYQMATKGLLLNSTNKIKKAILASGNAELIKDYTAWLDKKETLARFYSLSKEELTEQKIDLAGMEKEANDMERSLSQRSADFSQGYSTEKISYQQIASLLADNEASVEFVRVASFDKNFNGESKYAVLILTKGAAQPKLVILDNGNQLETRYAKFYRNSIQQKGADQYSYDQFWARIEPALEGKKVIYVSLDGVYNQISLNTLKKTDGDFTLNRYDLVTIGNSRDLIELKKRKAVVSKKAAFLMGFPDYGGNAVAALPGTKVEVDNIGKILKASGYQVTPYLQKTATEAVLKAMKGPAIVHIATHGYFLQDVDQSAAGVHEENAKNNPLLRSGILLSGASVTLKGDALPNLESNDNGVLTAYEAMNLNLDNTDLIVLSACETGLGDVRSGEGVYGLQRAFQVAGAKALVMSLWKVDDAATQALMTSFYGFLSKGISKQKAFKQAQVQLKTKFKDPYYWGAFVMTGM